MRQVVHKVFILCKFFCDIFETKIGGSMHWLRVSPPQSPPLLRALFWDRFLKDLSPEHSAKGGDVLLWG
eukprot:m.42768 g.42768  ORF g.42768 m.42768 type:complete len:69 (+) comp19206_c0_seq1:151-357(+)